MKNFKSFFAVITLIFISTSSYPQEIPAVKALNDLSKKHLMAASPTKASLNTAVNEFKTILDKFKGVILLQPDAAQNFIKKDVDKAKENFESAKALIGQGKLAKAQDFLKRAFESLKTAIKDLKDVTTQTPAA